MHSIKYFEMILHDKSPDPRALMNSWVTLGKKAQSFTVSNYNVSQLARCRRIMDGNKPYNPFEVR
jgi:hypothetical protein